MFVWYSKAFGRTNCLQILREETPYVRRGMNPLCTHPSSYKAAVTSVCLEWQWVELKAKIKNNSLGSLDQPF